MDRNQTASLAAALFSAAGLAAPCSLAQQTPVVAMRSAMEPDEAGRVDPEKTIRFNFTDAPYSAVLEFFSRESGVPMIRETEAPDKTMTFISGEAYSFDEALGILNRFLRMHNCYVARQDNYLYFRTLKAEGQKPSDPYPNGVPDDVPGHKIVTVTIPLENIDASVAVSKIQSLVDEGYGSVLDVPGPNFLIVTETADQCRRIRQIVSYIDAELADMQTELFPLKHAKAQDVFNALKDLVRVRTVQEIIDQKGNKRTEVKDGNVEGLNFWADERTNSVLVVGPEARIQVVGELIELLDVPGGGAGGAREMRTFTLESITPGQASQSLSDLFKGLTDDRKPTILPLDEVGKITVVASPTDMVHAISLMAQIDPGAASGLGELQGTGAGEELDRTYKVVRLTYVTPQVAQQIVSRLLTPRQSTVIKFTPSPDNKSLIVSGPEGDVAIFERLVSGIDVAPEVDKEFRSVRITAGDPAAVLNEAQSLYESTGQAKRLPVSVTLDESSRQVQLIGSREALGAFESVLRSVQDHVSIERETRHYDLTRMRASELAQSLKRLARPLLSPADGSTYNEPVFEPLDELDRLIVRAEPGQFTVIEELVTELDTESPGNTQIRFERVRVGEPDEVVARAKSLYAEQTAGMPERDAGPIDVQIDKASGMLVIRGTPGGIREFTQILGQVQQLVPPERTTRIVDVRNVGAAEIVEPLRQFLGTADPIDPARRVPDPEIAVVARTNSLLVTAEEAQHRMIADYVRRLDVIEQTDLPPLKLLQLKTADANSIASMLSQQYNKRPQSERAAKPVDIRADAGTNTLIVSAHSDLFDEIRTFVEELNKEGDQAPRTTILFPLKVAKAQEVAAAMDQLFPQPPMPRDRRNQPMPWLQEPKEVTVSAETSSNSLIIDAPTERIPSLEELAQKLDRVELPPMAELRTYRITKADLNAVATTLRGMASRGILSGPAQPGKPQVQVVVETEPRSSTLIVAGDDVTFDRVEQVLEDLNEVAVEKGLRIIPVANVPASELRERAVSIYDAQIESLPAATPVDVTINQETNSLEVVGDNEGLARFTQIVGELQRQAGPARDVRLIELRLAKVDEVIGFLEEMVAASESLRIQGGPEPVFEPIATTNSIMVAATPGQFPIIESLIRSLDSQKTVKRPPLKIMPLDSTDAQSLAQVLQRTYDQRPMDERAKKPVEIQADSGTNTLIVSAHEDVLPEVQAIVKDLNESRVGDEDREIRIFPLRVARAEDLGKTIDDMFPQPPMPVDNRGRPLPHLQKSKEIFVRADRATNSLIVDAPAKRIAEFDQIVEMLDAPRLSNVEVRTYKIERANLDSVTRTLQDLASRGALPNSGQTPVTVNTEPMSRTLVVSGPTEVFDAVEAVLEDLDAKPDIPGTTLRLHPLQHARAERLAPLLTELLTTRLREQQMEEGIAVTDIELLLHVAADGATNTLIISAPEGVQQVADELLKMLDTDAAQVGRAVVRVTPLVYTDASQVAQDLNQALQSYELPSGGEVSVVAARGSNALVLTGAKTDLDKVEKDLIANLDKQAFDPEKPSVETFELEYADAQDIAKTVERLLIEQQETDPRMLQLMARYRQLNPSMLQGPKIRVEAETRTNSLIVSGPSQTIELATAIINRLDEPADQADRTVLTFSPQRAEPGALVSAVSRIARETIPQQRRALEIVAEPATGSILVIGTDEQTAQAARLLAEFDDRTPIVPQVELGVFDLRHADGAAVARTVQSMLADPTRWPETLRKAERAGVAVPRPTVNADGSRLVVSVPSGLIALAGELIDTLDAPSQGVVDVRVFRLEKGDADSVAQVVRSSLESGSGGGPRPSVNAEPSSNSVVVSGTAAQLDKAAGLIEEMDASVEPAGLGVRTIFLKHARAEVLAPIVQSVLQKESVLDLLPEWGIEGYIRRTGMQPEQGVKVSAESRLNAIVVSAPKASLELAEQVVAELDVPGGDDGERRAIRVIPLLNADARELASNIEAVYEDDDTSSAPPTIRVDSASNALIVRASSDQMVTIEDLASRLDAAAVTSQRQLRMIPVDRSKAEAGLMAQTLKRLLEQQSGVKVEVISIDELLGGEAAEPTSEPAGKRGDAGPARLPGSLIERISALVLAAQPETPSGKGGGSAVQGPGDQDDGPRVRIAVDPETNMLVVVGSPRLTDRLNSLVSQLQSQMPSEPVGVHLIPLPETADANGIRDVVQRTVREVGQASPENPGGYTGRVIVTPDPNDQALIVWANETDFRSVGELIGSLIKLDSSTSLTVKVYPLENITAQRAIQAIDDLFSTSPRGRQARRIRGLDLELETPSGDTVKGEFDPSLVRVTQDPNGTSVIVAAPGESMRLIDRLIGVMDQSDVTERLSIRRYVLTNAKADELSLTLGQLFDAQRQGPNVRDIPRARFIADDRTNSMLVTASTAQHDEVERLLVAADAEAPDEGLELAIIPIQNARASTVESVIRSVLIGRDPAKEDRIQVSAEDDASLLVVRAEPEDLKEIRSIVSEVDQAEIGDYPVRTITLERADAQTVASSLQRFYQDRERGRRSGRSGPGVSIIGDRQSGTLVVAASDDVFAQIEEMVASFDREGAQRDMRLEIIRLKNANVRDIAPTLQDIAWDLSGGNVFFFGFNRNASQEPRDRITVQANERTNSLIIFGQGETFDTVLKIAAQLDEPIADITKRVVRAIKVENADLRSVAGVVRRVTENPDRTQWWRDDPDQVNVEIDQARRLVILIGSQDRVDAAAEVVERLASAAAPADRKIEMITLKHASAQDAERSLRRFFQARSRDLGLAESEVTVIGSDDGNVLIVSAEPEQMVLLEDLVARIDSPHSDGRRTEVYVLRHTSVNEAAATVERLMDTRGEDAVRVVAQPSTNSILVSTTEEQFEQVEALVTQLDVAPEIDDSSIVSIALEKARAIDVADALMNSLPDNIKVKITPVARSNSLIISGAPEAVALVVDQVPIFEKEPPKPAIELRRIALQHTQASEVAFSLDQLVRGMERSRNEPTPNIDYLRDENVVLITASADQIETLESWVKQLDVQRLDDQITEFIQLEYAQADQVRQALEVFYGTYAPQARTPGARAVSIVSDEVTNSLIIIAGKDEWENIRSLLGRFDDPRYDAEQQLRLIPLKHAEAGTVARALNEGFRAPIENQLQRERIQAQARQQNRGRAEEDFLDQPSMLIDFDDTPIVTAEPTTNSLIVFASIKQIERIEKIVQQLDSDTFVQISEPRIIPVTSGRASEIAQTIRDTFQDRTRRRGVSGLVVVGNDAAGVIVVRADESDFAQIRALAESLQQEGAGTMPSVRIVSLTSTPAARVRQTVLSAFQPIAQQRGERLAIEVDRTGNRLVISSSEVLFEQIEQLAKELDGELEGVLAPGEHGDLLSQSIVIVDVANNAPSRMTQLLNQLGVTRDPPQDRPGVVSEAVQVVPLSSRSAVALVGSSADIKAVEGLIASLDAEPPSAEQYVSLLALKQNDAGDVVESLRRMLDVTDSGGGAFAAPAEALTEQVRRLSVARHGLGKEDLELDLSVPIRLIADDATNSIMVASTRPNVMALKEVIDGMDTLPIGEAVVVRIFPLENADAGRSKRVIDELFERGEQLRRLPGTDRQGLPTTTTGVALAGEIAVSVDERTNALIVAGREEAVAFVEVLIGQMDSDEAANWVETRVITLEHADAVDLAETLRTVIVHGRTDLPGAAGIQRQIARLRVKKDAGSPGVEADVFAPLTDVIIVPEEQLNALIVVASPANLDAVAELTSMLDIELAAADNTVRVYPLAFAAADRVANLIDQFFQRRQRTGAMRAEDEVIIAPDLRTNSLFISTSPRSFSLIESLLKTLDGEERDYTVGIHVVPVPNADVQQLAPKIQEAMRQRIDAGRRAGEVASPTDTFSVSADPANKLLIVTSSEENLAVVKDLLDSISVQTSPDVETARGFEIIPVTSQSPEEIARYIDEIYVRKEIEKRGDGAISVQPNERLGALIVTGSEYDIAQVRRLVQQLDTAEVVQQRVVRRFELRSADALQLVNLIEQVLAGPPVARNVRNTAAFKVKYNEAEMELDAATRAQISVTPEIGTNSIFVQAPPQALAFIEEVISSVETSDNVRRTIETFHLVNADARQMAQLLSALLNLQQQGDRLILIPSRVDEEEDPEGLVRPGIGRTQLTAVPDERQELSITIDARTNTLLVSGTEEYLSLVREIVGELDSFEANERSTLVYELQNAKAEEIEQRLQALYRAESEARQRTLDPAESGSSSSVFEREVTVVGDIASNKIIVQTSPRYIQTVEDLIRELDARPPQVDIQVLLAEVTLNDQSTWGVDFNVNFGGDDYLFDSLIGSGPLSALGVPNLELSSTDFQIMVTALEAQGRLEILSKPNVTVNNNQPARINVGENIAIATGVQFFAQGNSSAIIERRDVGIIMDVTPSISSDGYVRLDIAPTISQVSQISDQLSENVSSPRINTREVSTTVTVKDGQTIVIGGLIQTTENDRRTKVPILGDIPGLGEIFKGYDVESVKTELLVILTPTIIPGEGEAHNERVSRILTQEIMQRSNPDSLVDVIQSMDRERPLHHDTDPNAPKGPAGSLPSPDHSQPPESQQPEEVSVDPGQEAEPVGSSPGKAGDN